MPYFSAEESESSRIEAAEKYVKWGEFIFRDNGQ